MCNICTFIRSRIRTLPVSAVLWQRPYWPFGLGDVFLVANGLGQQRETKELAS